MDTLQWIAPTFEQSDLCAALDQVDDAALNEVSFGVIGFDGEGIVRRYNTAESRLAGLCPERVLGLLLFGVVSPCMNNHLVAQRFEDCRAQGESLDVTLDYVLSLRMKPIKVTLRLLSDPAQDMRYVCVRR